MKKILTLVLLVIGFLFISFTVFLNLTPGRFGYADDDGCSCVVSYNTSEPKPDCGFTRGNQCSLFLDKPLLLFNLVDFNR